MTKQRNFILYLDVKFHDRCKCNRHKTRKTIVFINFKLDGTSHGNIEHKWEVICRVTADKKITWEYDGTEIPEKIMDEVISMFSEEEIIETIKNLPVSKKF